MAESSGRPFTSGDRLRDNERVIGVADQERVGVNVTSRWMGSAAVTVPGTRIAPLLELHRGPGQRGRVDRFAEDNHHECR